MDSGQLDPTQLGYLARLIFTNSIKLGQVSS